MSQRKTPEEILTDEKPYTYKGNYLYSGSSVLSVMKKFAKQEVEARDELIKEVKTLLENFRSSPPSMISVHTLNGIDKWLTKAQSFNQE